MTLLLAFLAGVCVGALVVGLVRAGKVRESVVFHVSDYHAMDTGKPVGFESRRHGLTFLGNPTEPGD